jgi:putative endonuclease
MRRYYVYIMTNHARTLYTGVTSDLERRTRQHKLGEGRFTSQYRATRLVWFEEFYEAEQAILAEKRIKGWVRRKKIELIEQTNPLWLDLAEQLVGHSPSHSEVCRRILPPPTPNDGGPHSAQNNAGLRNPHNGNLSGFGDQDPSQTQGDSSVILRSKPALSLRREESCPHPS